MFAHDSMRVTLSLQNLINCLKSTDMNYSTHKGLLETKKFSGSQFNVVLKENAAVHTFWIGLPAPIFGCPEWLYMDNASLFIGPQTLLEARWSRCQTYYLQFSSSSLTHKISTIPHHRSLTLFWNHTGKTSLFHTTIYGND